METRSHPRVPGEGPGKRWKFSVAYDGLSMMVFGGHRLWHGFATDNSESNSWSSSQEYPKGGYLQDLWVYTKTQLGKDEQVFSYTYIYIYVFPPPPLCI